MTTKSTTSRTEQTIRNLQFWLNPEYHNYHVGAVAATIREAINELDLLRIENGNLRETLRDAMRYF